MDRLQDIGGFRTTSVVLLAILSISSVVLNGFCLYVIRTSRSLLRKSSTFLIINLLVLQLFQGLVVLPFYIAKQINIDNNELKKTICNGFRFSYMVTFYGTCLGVLLTSVDRFLAVYWLTTYKWRVTKQRVACASIATWIYVLLLCLIPFFNDATNNEGLSLLGELCDYKQTKTWTIIMLCINSAIPYIIIVCCYRYVIKTVKFIEMRSHPRNSQCFDVTLDNSHVVTLKKRDMMKHRKITSLVLSLCFVYAVLWAPSIAYYSLLHICPTCFQTSYRNSSWSIYADFIIKYIAFLNALATPFIYCFYQKDFRRSVPASLRKSQDFDADQKKLIPTEL